jgi:flagellar biosynthesis protein FlhF
MQVKKFEAPTLQEALDTIKRELGPEAIILQTKQNRRGFGLMSNASVEVTAAVSERATDKKKNVERRMPDAYAQKVGGLNVSKQLDIYESYLEKKVGEKDKVQLSSSASQAATADANKRLTAVRYADIEDDAETKAARASANAIAAAERTIPQYAAPAHLENAIETYSNSREGNIAGLHEEILNLKRLVDELRRERKKPEYIDSDSPFSATEALQEAYETLLQSGVERRFSVQIMREVAKNLSVESRADHDVVLDAIADRLLKRVNTRPFFGANASGNLSGNSTNSREIHAFVGASGVGKTALLAKLATHSARQRSEKIGLVRIQLTQDEGSDPLNVFAKALHVPYRAVNTIEEFQVALQDMSQCQRIFIDTPGLSAKDGVSIRRLQTILGSSPAIKVQFVVSTLTRDLEVHNQARAFAILQPEALMFTRLDETNSFGGIYSLSNRVNLPMTVFSTGRKVTEDWENASPERLTASILNIL